MSARRKHILVVDDEQAFGDAIGMALRSIGHSSMSVPSAEGALGYLQNYGVENVDLLITDIQMPGMNGEELVAQVRRQSRTLPILAMTAYGDKDLVVRLMRNGCTDYIEKPFHLDEIQDRADALLANGSSAQQNERLAKIGESAASMAHDLNNQLAALGGFRDMLEAGLDDPRKLRYCQVMRRGLFKAGHTLNSVMATLDGTPVPDPLRAEVDVRDLVETVLSLSTFRTPVNLTIRPGCRVKARKDRLEMVVWNLIKNADEAQRGTENGSITVSCEKRTGSVVVHIADNGPGIPEEHRDQLFGLGKTFGKHTGNGLGLYSCRQSVEALGGSIWFETEVGTGTTFFVELPMNDTADTDAPQAVLHEGEQP